MSVNREGLEKLAPCECGRPAKLQGTQIVEGRATRWYARCELATCWFGPERDSPERAAESWNRRALLAEAREEGKLPDEWHCITCGLRDYGQGGNAHHAVTGHYVVLSPPAFAGTEGPGLRKAMEAIHAKHYRGPLDFKDDRGVQVGVSMVKADIAKALAARPVEGEKV